MNLSISKFPLYAGVFILAQVAPREVSVEEQLLNILIQGGVGIVTLYIFWQFTRQVAKENERRDATFQQIITLVSSQSSQMQKMDESEARKEERWMELSTNNTKAVESLATAISALDARTGSQVTISQQNQVILNTISTSLEDVKTRLGSLEVKIETKFPSVSEFKSEFAELKTSLERVAKRCEEEAKRATDEQKVTVTIAPPTNEPPDISADDAKESAA